MAINSIPTRSILLNQTISRTNTVQTYGTYSDLFDNGGATAIRNFIKEQGLSSFDADEGSNS